MAAAPVQKLRRILNMDSAGYSLLDQNYRSCWTRQLAKFSQDMDS